MQGLTHVKVSKPTPYGDIRSEWKVEGKIFRLSVSVPFGASATITLPESQRKQTIKSGDYTFETIIE